MAQRFLSGVLKENELLANRSNFVATNPQNIYILIYIVLIWEWNLLALSLHLRYKVKRDACPRGM